MDKDELNIQLAKKADIPLILDLFKERCKWFYSHHIYQWDECYYTQRYNQRYFLKVMKKYQLYVAKQGEEVIGSFLLKNIDSEYWLDHLNAYYIHHFIGKVDYHGIGIKMLDFIEKLARNNKISVLRLDCVKQNPKINEYWKNCGFENRGEFTEPYEGVLWEKKIK